MRHYTNMFIGTKYSQVGLISRTNKFKKTRTKWTSTSVLPFVCLLVIYM